MAILAALPKPNPFVSPPPKPNINDPPKPLPPLPIPIPKYPPPPPKPTTLPSPALKSFHRRTHYRRSIPSSGLISSEPDGRSVVLGDSGLSYQLPGAPFEFQFSYSETPKARPLAIREPAFLPFAPPSMARPWTGKPPLKKPNRKKVPLVSPLCPPHPDSTTSPGPKVLGVRTPLLSYGRYPSEKKRRGEILGHPLNRQEIRELVRPHLSSNRQVNLGRDGLTHNMLELVHTHWRRDKVCKVRCRGVPTVDMNNICRHLEEKTGGKIIHRIGGVVYLFRGRNYDHRTRPQYPIMLWKPAAPVYPKLIQEAPEGLTKAEADELRRKGENLLPICKLAKNGIYINLVKDVRQAFESSSLVKINCQGMHATDYKKLGAKLKELVPCVLLSFDEEQILMWRGSDWKSMYHSVPSNNPTSSGLISSETQGGFGRSGGAEASKKSISGSKMMSLWKRAIESNKALLLNENETNLCPDDLLQKVDEFASLSQVKEHSFPAVVVNYPSSAQTEIEGSGPDFGLEVENQDRLDDYNDNDDFTDMNDDDIKSFVPLGSLPVDSLAQSLDSE